MNIVTPHAASGRTLACALACSVMTWAGGASAQQAESDRIASSAGPLELQPLARLEYPWGMAPLPDGRLLITEKPGRLRAYGDDGLSSPIDGVPDVAYRGQGGLLDVAVDPGFADNGLIYLYAVVAADEQPADATVDADPRLGQYVDEEDTTLKGGVVLRARLDDGALSDVETLWEQTPKVVGLGHYGGRLLFAPDGRLIVTSGERQSFTPAQSEGSNLGKVLRLDPDGSVPADNPFAGRPAPLDAVLSSGHRNPLGAAYRPGTDELWIHEMGPAAGDELQRVRAGADFGWPAVSNGEHYNRVEIPHHETAPDRYVGPDFYWRPAISPSGLAFYQGSLFPDWDGDALIGGLSSKALVRVNFDDGRPVGDERIALNRRVRDVEIAADGSILVLIDAEDGALMRLTRAAD